MLSTSSSRKRPTSSTKTPIPKTNIKSRRNALKVLSSSSDDDKYNNDQNNDSSNDEDFKEEDDNYDRPVQ